MAGYNANQYWAYRDGRDAGELLRAVKGAQRLYLADNPTNSVTDIQEADILKYLPPEIIGKNKTLQTSLPLVNKIQPTIDYNSYPPVAKVGGVVYDPGAKDDGQWDSGK